MSKSNVLELARKLVAAIEKEDLKNKVMLKDIPVGGKFDTGIGRFIVLDQKGNCTAVITEGLYHNQEEFDGYSANYSLSKLRKHFYRGIYPAFLEEFGDENLCYTPASLISVDMQKKYGSIDDKVRPLTFDEARKYNDLLVNKWLTNCYWTCTPWSTKERGCGHLVAIVTPSGHINYTRCDYGKGARPFCILKSNIFVSKIEEE